MDKLLEEILNAEVMNTDWIHLYYYPELNCWKAYEQSALNLIRLVPEMAPAIFKETQSEECIFLRCITVDEEQTVRYRLPDYCLLIGDKYIKLSLQEQMETDYIKI